MPLVIDINLRTGPSSLPAVSIALRGSLDTATAPELEQQLKPILAAEADVSGPAEVQPAAKVRLAL